VAEIAQELGTRPRAMGCTVAAASMGTPDMAATCSPSDPKGRPKIGSCLLLLEGPSPAE
jgi:hypothetical protein